MGKDPVWCRSQRKGCLSRPPRSIALKPREGGDDQSGQANTPLSRGGEWNPAGEQEDHAAEDPGTVDGGIQETGLPINCPAGGSHEERGRIEQEERADDQQDEW